MTNVFITGTGHTPFRKWQDTSIETLIAQAAQQAITDSGVDQKDITEIFIGHYGEGLIDQGFVASLVLNAFPQWRYLPITRVENACASGSAAVHQGCRAIANGEHQHVLVLGAEHMSGSANPGACLAKASYIAEESFPSFTHAFAHLTDAYFDRFSEQTLALAKIAHKNHQNGLRNDLAHLRKDFDLEFCLTESPKNPVVAGHLKRTDCSPITDGAAAMVLSGAPKPGTENAKISYWQHHNEFLPLSKRNPWQLEGCAHAWQQGLAKTQLSLDDFQLVETHDCFTIAELMQYEAMGLTPIGEGSRALDEGWVYRDGKLPVNVSGGLKSKGHPIGATGVSMHVMAARQLTGTAGDMQLPSLNRAGVFNMGGTGAANYLSFIEAV